MKTHRALTNVCCATELGLLTSLIWDPMEEVSPSWEPLLETEKQNIYDLLFCKADMERKISYFC